MQQHVVRRVKLVRKGALFSQWASCCRGGEDRAPHDTKEKEMLMDQWIQHLAAALEQVGLQCVHAIYPCTAIAACCFRMLNALISAWVWVN